VDFTTILLVAELTRIFWPFYVSPPSSRWSQERRPVGKILNVRDFYIQKSQSVQINSEKYFNK
jgi:hypothetical protein